MSNTHDHLNNWLDAFGSGTSTPESREASENLTFDLRDATRQLHDLARQANRAPIDQSLPDSWEEFMQPIFSIATASSVPIHRPKPLVALPPTGRTDRWITLDRAAGLLVAAALLIALSAGIWRAADWSNNPPPNPTSELSALVQGTPDGQGTPTAMEPVDLPTAEDCTVEPLTVDEVLWYVTDPIQASASADIDHPAPDPTVYVEATTQPGFDSAIPTDQASGPPSTPADTTAPTVQPGYASADQINQVAAMQWMWMACVLADSFFQKWALEDPNLVREQVLSVLPPLTGESEARVILGQLQNSGADDLHEIGGILFSNGLSTSMDGAYPTLLVDLDPTNTFANQIHVTIGYDTFAPDGTFYPAQSIFDGEVITNDPTGPPIKVLPGCWNFQFLWNEARGSWLVLSPPICG